jgi:DNA-binding NtrC family response regulator
MTISVIRVDTSLDANGLSRFEVGPDVRRDLLAAKAGPRPAALIIREEDIAALHECTDLIIDRGRKIPAKHLSALLLGHEQMPLVRGFTSTGQLLRSVRTLLHHASEQADSNLFLIGTAAATFTELSRRAKTAPPPGGGNTPVSAVRSSLTARTVITYTQTLTELLPELPVPETLVDKFIGDSVEVRLVRQLIVRAAQQDTPVLILGDTGTGKEVVARLIHHTGSRQNQNFRAVNCGAIPRELLESELFGYEKGAHSTAGARKPGLWQAADRGTLFLDEIGDLPLDHQVKVLRALDTGEIQPVGAERPVRVDARILAATNRDLFAMVRARQFREDLYYRLRAFMIRTPPLRAHPADIPTLAQTLWKQITREAVSELPAPVVSALQSRGWPGNVRELKMCLTSLFGLFGAKGLRVEHLRAVFEFEQQAVGAGESADQLNDVAVHRIHCLRHLRQVDEVLRAAQVPLRDVMRGRTRNPDAFRAIAAATDDRVNELEVLCAHPLLFHGVPTFTVVRRLKEGLRDFADQLREDPDKGLAYWKKELEPDFAFALTAVFEEVDKIVKPG